MNELQVNNQSTPVNLICAKRVAKILNINVRTVWKFLRNKPGFPQPVKRFPRYTRWDEGAIRRWVEL